MTESVMHSAPPKAWVNPPADVTQAISELKQKCLAWQKSYPSNSDQVFTAESWACTAAVYPTSDPTALIYHHPVVSFLLVALLAFGVWGVISRVISLSIGASREYRRAVYLAARQINDARRKP